MTSAVEGGEGSASRPGRTLPPGKTRYSLYRRSRWEDTIKMDPKEIGWEDLNCVVLAEDSDKWQAVVNAVMNLRVL